MITVDIEITADDRHFRVIHFQVEAINREEGLKALTFGAEQCKGDECVYQMCAPCPLSNSTLNQPFYDFFNGFHLLQSDIWGNQDIKNPF